MIAVDAATGKQKWKFDPKVPDANIPYTADCRGIAYYEVPNAAPTDPCATRIIEGTLDARVIAIDAKTGTACTGFGAQGIFTPPTDPAKISHWIEYPGYNGGTDWGSAAIDPARGIIISNYNDTPNYNELVPRPEADKRGWFKRDQTKGPIGGAEGAEIRKSELPMQ